ncbi:MAG: prepilin-type N-terminal cleavage/methylation domain-containing protein, partial [Planctomycetota bacterium]
MHKSGVYKPASGTGFTLVELLLVLVISSVIVLAINAVYRQAHLIWASVEDRRPIYHEARAVIETLRQELSCLYFPPAPDANDVEDSEAFEPISVVANDFAFYTLAPSWKTGLGASRMARVRYSLAADPVTEEKVLQRFERLCAGEKPIGKESRDIVARGLSEFSVSVIGDDQPESGADGSDSKNQSGTPPKAVKVSLSWA